MISAIIPIRRPKEGAWLVSKCLSDAKYVKNRYCSTAPHTPHSIGIPYPSIVDTARELPHQQQAALEQDSIRSSLEKEVPPVIRSVLELSHYLMIGHSQWLRATPGYQGGLFYDGKPFCFVGGYRDSSRPMDMNDKANHMRLKDPLMYETLSLPITSAYLCELHQRNIFILETPIAHYLPELGHKLDDAVTARSILSCTATLNDWAIASEMGVQHYKVKLSRNVCQASQQYIYEPINKFLAANSSQQLGGQQQRENFVRYLATSRKVCCQQHRRTLSRKKLSHFTVALLIAAAERCLKTESFERSIKSNFFDCVQANAASYGPPKTWRNPADIFYQPTGQASLHTTFKTPVATQSHHNCAPPIFNLSMNLHAPPEDYAKLLLLSIQTIIRAREALKHNDTAKHRKGYDFAVYFDPAKKQISLAPKKLDIIGYIPSAAAFNYNTDHKLGTFGVTSCGTRGAHFFASTLSTLIQHIFIKHIIQTKSDTKTGINVENLDSTSDGGNKIQRLLEKQHMSKIFKNFDRHTRY